MLRGNINTITHLVMDPNTPSKRCFKCSSVKPLTEFYAHPQMADGHLNKCKECTKRDVKIRYEAKDGLYEYEQTRARKPTRRANRIKYGRAHNERNPDKYKARYTLSNAVRDGKIVRGSCAHCGTTENVQAHHHDYSKPLDVEWACFKCHREREHGQKTRGHVESIAQ